MKPKTYKLWAIVNRESKKFIESDGEPMLYARKGQAQEAILGNVTATPVTVTATPVTVTVKERNPNAPKAK